jgi:hypothetical protein
MRIPVSLTSEIRSEHSPLSNWLVENVNHIELNKLIDKLNHELSQRERVCYFDNSPATMGQAFDFSFRWLFEEPSFEKSAILRLASKRVFSNEKEAWHLLLEQNKKTELAIVSAWFENYVRGTTLNKKHEKARSLYNDMDKPEQVVLSWLSLITQDELNDIRTLTAISKISYHQQITSVKDGSLNWEANPVFDRMETVGGADGDWIIGNTLYDAKCSWKKQPATADMFFQVYLYVALSWFDELKRYQSINKMALYFPRHNYEFVLSLEEFENKYLVKPMLESIQDNSLGSAFTTTRDLYNSMFDYMFGDIY